MSKIVIIVNILLLSISNLATASNFQNDCEVLNNDSLECSFSLDRDHPTMLIKAESRSVLDSYKHSIRNTTNDFCKNTKHSWVMYILLDESLVSGEMCNGKKAKWITYEKFKKDGLDF